MAYGEQILPTPSAQLAPAYGQGSSERNLARVIQFADVFPDPEIVAALSRQCTTSVFDNRTNRELLDEDVRTA
jgi:hypothetical protein